MYPSTISQTSSGRYSKMDLPFPLRSPYNAGFVAPSFDRHARRVRKNHHVHQYCVYRRPPRPTLLKRKYFPHLSLPESPVMGIKRRRQLNLFGGCLPCYSDSSSSNPPSSDSDSDSDNNTLISYGYPHCESPTSWLDKAGRLESQPIPLSPLDLAFHAAVAASHLADLDVEGLIASPGHELTCHDHLTRNGSSIYHDLEPHPPRWHCMCHGCRSHGLWLLPAHDPSHRCFCIACMSFFAKQEQKQKQKLEAEIARAHTLRRYGDKQAENARQVQAYRLQLQWGEEDVEEGEVDEDEDEMDWEGFLDGCEEEEEEAARELFDLQMERLRCLKGRK